IAELQAFVGDGNTGHIANANANADATLTHMSQVAIPVNSDELQSLGEAATSYRNTLEEQLRRATASIATIRSDTDGLSSKIAEMGTDITAERQRLAQLASDHQSQFSVAQETRGREFTETQTSRQDKFAGIVSEYTQRLLEQNADFTREKELAVRQYQED